MRSLGSDGDDIVVDDDLKVALSTDYSEAAISDRNKLMLAYAEKVTREPASVDRAYVDRMKEIGFTDHELHDIVQVTAFFNYINRLADGLGVELEAE